MAKPSSSHVHMMSLLRAEAEEEARSSAATAAQSMRMKLNAPPERSRKTLDEMLASDSQDKDSSLSDLTTQVFGGGDVSIGESIVAETDAQAEGVNESFMLPLTALKRHPWNARVHRSQARIRQLAAEMAQGQDAPVLIARDPSDPNTYFVVDGETRLLSAEYLKWPQLWVRLVDVDPSKPLAFFSASLSKTNNTETISPIDQGIRYAELVEKGHATIDEIASDRGIHRSAISRMMSYARFPDQVRAYMHEHPERFPYSVSAALAPAALLDPDTLLAYCRRIAEEELSRRDVEAYVKGIDAPEKTRTLRRTLAISRALKTGTGVVGTFKTFESGALEFKLNAFHGLSDEVYTKLIAILSEASDAIVAPTPIASEVGKANKGSSKA